MSADRAATNWWETFFAGLPVEFWRAAIPDEVTDADVAFLWKHLRADAGARILDVPCGDGRIAVPLARRGAAVTGVDISTEFIAAAERRGREAGVAAGRRGRQAGSVRWSNAEMRRLPPYEAFDAAFCFGNSFGFLDDAGNAGFFEAVARALKPGGRFALDYGQAAESVFPRLEPRSEGEVGGIRFVEETRYDVDNARIENRFEFSRGDERQVRLASQRVYAISELRGLLDRAGLRPIALFGTTAEEPFGLGSPRALVVAEKASIFGS